MENSLQLRHFLEQLGGGSTVRTFLAIFFLGTCWRGSTFEKRKIPHYSKNLA
jgi:hypothetical protein